MNNLKNLTILIVLELVSSFANGQSIKNFDLNGDGVKEKIELSNVDNKVSINGKIFYRSSGKLLKSDIVDLNTSDKFKELQIEVQPESTDFIEKEFYTIDENNNIVEVGSTQSPKILGNGIVYGEIWAGFYMKKLKFVLSKKHKLEEVKTDISYVDKDYKVIKTFDIYNEYTENANSSAIASIAEKSIINIVAIYKNNWILIKTSNGLLGWTKLDQNCFENFTMAG